MPANPFSGRFGFLVRATEACLTLLRLGLALPVRNTLTLGLKVIGLLGVLMEAKHHGLVPVVKPILHSLIEKAGFWVTRDLYDRRLLAAGEPQRL